jgi:hypothetical protein
LAYYSYLVEGSILLDDEIEPIPLSTMFRSLENSNDYDNSVFPLLRLRLRMDFETYYKVQNNDSARFSLTIKKFRQEDVEMKNFSTYTYYMKNKIFVPIDREKSPINKPTDLQYEPDNMPSLNASFIIMSKEDLDNNKRMVNTVLTNTDIEGAILYLANKFSKKPIVFQKPDNQKVYRQIILPPNNIIRSLKYLDTVYGIYNNGLRAFFDYDSYHIINKYDNTDLPSVNGRKRKLYIKVFDSSGISADDLFYDSGMTNPIDDTDEFFSAQAHIADIRFINYEDSKKEFVGTNNIVLSQGLDGINSNQYKLSDEKTRVFYNRYNNPFKESEMVLGGKMGRFLVCTLDAVDMDAIAPNNEYKVEFANKGYSEYTGDYHILKSEIVFNIGDSGFADMQTKLYFRRK